MVERRRPKGIEPHGKGIRIRIQHKGKKYQKTIHGNYYSKSDLAAAEQERNRLKSRLALGLPIDEHEDSEFTLFAEDAQQYLNNHDTDYSTAIEYEKALNRYWLPTLGNRISQDIPTKEIKALLATFDISRKTKRNILVPLRGVFDHAEVKPNPADIKIKPPAKTKIHRYRPKESQAVMEAIEKRNDVFANCYFALLLGGGLRPGGEPLGLQWPDWDGARFHIQRTIVRGQIKSTTKNHEERYVYIPKWVRPYINALPSRFSSAWLFPHPKPKKKGADTHLYDARDYNSIFREIFNDKTIKHDLKLSWQRPYVLRHTRAAELLSTGVEPVRAAQQLGHSLEMFYRIYSELIEEFRRDNDEDLEGFDRKTAPELPRKERKNAN